MDTHSTRPTTAARPVPAQPSTEQVIKADAALKEAQKPTTSSRPSSFSARAAATPLPKFPTKKAYAPEPSHLGRYITYGVIALLVILLIFQVISKGSLRRQVSSLQSQNETLTERLATLQQQLLAQGISVPTSGVVPPGTTEPAEPETLTLLTYPVMYRESDYQKIGQTIRVTTDTEVGSVVLRGVAGDGDDGQVAIYEDTDFYSLDDDKPMAKESFDTGSIPAGQPFTVEFPRGVKLKANTDYILVVETTNRNASADIAYRTATAAAPGTMWVRTRRLSQTGEVLSEEFSWQELPGYDLFFELHAAE